MQDRVAFSAYSEYLGVMPSAPIQLIFDAHVHLYPCYSLSRALNILWDRLNRWVPPDGQTACRLMALVAQRTQDPPLADLLATPNGALEPDPWMIRPEPGPPEIWIARKATGAELILIGGRQFATHEKMEVLTIRPAPDRLEGQPIRQIVSALGAEGLTPILPWSPGKWLAGRGRIIAELIAQNGPALALCDTAIRPRLTPEPPAFDYARQAGCRILAGSDPLPVPGEEKELGGYATSITGTDFSGHPEEAVQWVLSHSAPPMVVLGARNSPVKTLSRLIHYQFRRGKAGRMAGSGL